MGKISTNKKVYQCCKCKKSYLNRSHLSRHKQTCLGVRKFICDVCEADSTRKDSLNKHRKKCKGGLKKKTVYTECNVEFVTAWRYNRHLEQAHTQKPTYTCSKCNKKFERKTFFQKHLVKCLPNGNKNIQEKSNFSVSDTPSM